ncbi:MAG: 3-dehydroquinate synthase [Acidobacteria bacterium]|nr:3-dehydroquinate synthase [Acidobacteriota bacterium]
MLNPLDPVIVNTNSQAKRYLISVGEGLLDSVGDWARESLGNNPRKLMIVSNRRVYRLYGEQTAESLRSSGFEVCVWLMKDGERYKSLQSTENLLRALGAAGFTRSDSLLALGGGVVGDLAGFASAIYLRGIRFLQVPTTLLAMIDSSVGGKTGVNTEFGKNLIGAFHHPSAVLADVSTLRTLARREIVAGLCEAVKHAALAGGELFDRTKGFLEANAKSGVARGFGIDGFTREISELIVSQISFKAAIVSGDQSEETGRSDSKSRKILNFGHTFGHALEKVTSFRHFKHGEAVGLGILFAARLSKSLEFLDSNEINLLNDVVRLVGKLPDTRMIDLDSVIESFGSDKKNIAGDLQWILLKGIGKPVIVSSNEIPDMSIRSCLAEFLVDSD